MTVERKYRCNLCRDSINVELIGLYWKNSMLVEVPFKESENHLCLRCLSHIQAFEPVCGGGMRGCNGGPECMSDHK
jgi:hypothetical protein